MHNRLYVKNSWNTSSGDLGMTSVGVTGVEFVDLHCHSLLFP